LSGGELDEEEEQLEEEEDEIKKPRPRIIKKPRPRIDRSKIKPRISWEQLLQQAKQDRLNAKATAITPRPTRTYHEDIRDKYGEIAVTVKRVVPMTEEEEARTLGRIDPDAWE
jgi:hypothetical protein